VPDSPAFPQALRNAPVIVLAICYAGPVAKGEEVLRPVRQFGPPVADLVQPMPYDVAQLSADFIWPPGHRQYWKSSFLRDLGDDTIDTVIEHFARVPSRRTVIVIDHNGGGAISRVGADATAFGHRNWTYNFLVTSAWSEPAQDEQNLAWTRSLWSAMQPWLANAVYVNYTGDQTSETLRSAYPVGTFERLKALKNAYDASNLFRLNHNVEPTHKAALAGNS